MDESSTPTGVNKPDFREVARPAMVFIESYAESALEYFGLPKDLLCCIENETGSTERRIAHIVGCKFGPLLLFHMAGHSEESFLPFGRFRIDVKHLAAMAWNEKTLTVDDRYFGDWLKGYVIDKHPGKLQSGLRTPGTLASEVALTKRQQDELLGESHP